jgi:hypothetical protein
MHTMLSAGARELVEAALRVLNRWTLGQKPAMLDVQLLQQHAPPHESALEPDELACATVARECRKIMARSETPVTRKR